VVMVLCYRCIGGPRWHSGYGAVLQMYRGIAVAQWLRCCATNRKVAGSISAGATGIFH